MERLKQAAIIIQLVRNLRKADSWCGETQIQKAMYLMQDLLEVPTDFPFILYKHGPFSFDLSYELTSLRADELLELQPQAPPYGPRYAATRLGESLCQRYPKTLQKYEPAIASVTEAIGGQTVGELERVATALYVTKRQSDRHDGTVNSRAKHLTFLKPHISFDAATKAVKEIDALAAQLTESE